MFKNKKSVYSWVLYDWANSAFATTVLAAVLPIFYKDVAAADLAPHIATSYWGYTQTAAMIIIAVLSPILGAAADYSDSKKSFLKFFVFLGTSATAVLFFVERGNYITASIFFITANIGFAGGNVFYDGFLTDIASDENIDFISSLGYAAGYLGGGILLAINLLMISRPQLFFISDSTKAVRISFVTVAVWWLLFSIPAFVNLPSSRIAAKKISLKEQSIIGFKRLRCTFRNIKKYRELWKFLLAFWLYNDGIGTIIRMAAIYGREIGIGQSDLIGALLMTQFIGIPFALIFGRMGQHFGAKKGIFAALLVYVFITGYGFFLSTALDFWILAALVGVVQGGAQALSRSLYGSMIPRDKSAEFFGFFGVSSKFAAVLGPTVFAAVSQLTGSGRNGILAVALFFILGMIMLSAVDVEKGRSEARQ